jgi:hypothetical protein
MSLDRLPVTLGSILCAALAFFWLRSFRSLGQGLLGTFGARGPPDRVCRELMALPETRGLELEEISARRYLSGAGS